MLVLGFALAGNVAVHANAAFNGTWGMGINQRLILNNGNWTMQIFSNNAWHDEARGTFTTRGDTIALHTTHIYRGLMDRAAARAAFVSLGQSAHDADRSVFDSFGGAIGSLWGTSALRLEATYGREPFRTGVLPRQ